VVGETLRANPPAPYTLWRYTSADVEIAGVRVPARSPVLVDIQGVGTGPDTGPDLTFGAGPHFRAGARPAVLEPNAVAAVLAADYPKARLDVAHGELRLSGIGGIQGRRLDALPVRPRGWPDRPSWTSRHPGTFRSLLNSSGAERDGTSRGAQ